MPSLRLSSSEHPDAKLVIRSLTTTSLELELHTADGVTLAPFGPIHLEREPDRFFKELFSEIEGLPARYGTSQEAHRELEDLGAELSKRLLPLELGWLLAEIRGGDLDELRTLWIQSDEPWIPWELLRLPSSTEDRGFQGSFLGGAFAVARWLRVRPASGHLTPHRSFPMRRLAVVAPHDRRLDSVAGEVAFLEQLGDDERGVERIPANEDEVRQALALDRHDAWHFSGHGLPNDEPARAEILFGNNQCLRSRSLYAGMLEARRPLVFLNACHTGLTGFSLTGVGGWAEGFLSAGAGAFIGAYWAIEDAPAARFTNVFYTAFLEGLPIAAAVLRARLAIRDEFPGDPTWLAYTLYAHPLATRKVEGDSPEGATERIPVLPLEDEGEERSVRCPSSPESRSSETSRERARFRPFAMLVTILLAISLVTVLATRLRRSAPSSVIVLSPVNKTGAVDEGWRLIATSELLTAALIFDGKVRALDAGDVFRDGEWPGPKQTEHLFRHFGASYLVHGTLELVFQNEGRFIRIDLYLRELPDGREKVRVTLERPEEEWFELIFEAARSFRRELGVGIRFGDAESEVLTVFPTDQETLKLYMTGLGKLRRFDNQGAFQAFSETAVLAPELSLVQMQLATAAVNLGDLASARDASRKAFDSRSGLPSREKLLVEALFHEIHEDWSAATEAHRNLWATFSEDPEYGFRLAEAQINAGQAESSLATLGKLRKLPLSELERGEADLLEAEVHLALGAHEPASTAAENAVKRGAEIGAGDLEARARLRQAEVFEQKEEYQLAQETLEIAKRLFEATPKNRAGVWATFSKLAIVLYWQGGVEGAEERFTEYEEDYARLGDSLGVAMARANLGLILPDKGEYRRAEEILGEILPQLLKLGLSYEAAVVANGLGYSRQLNGRPEAAKESYALALEIFDELGHRGRVALIRTNLGEIAFLQGDLAAARHLHESARAVNRELQDAAGEAYDTYRLGVVHMAMGSFDDARNAFDDALALSSAGRATRAETTLALAEMEFTVKNYERTRNLAIDAEQAFWNTGWVEWAVLSQVLQARSLLASEPGELATVRELGRRARRHAANSEDSRVRVALALLEARMAMLEDDRDALAESLAKLEQLADEVQEVPYLFEVRLAQAETEEALGRQNQARSRLDRLVADAGGKGFKQIETRARALLRTW